MQGGCVRVLAMMFVGALAGCATSQPRIPHTEAEADAARIAGLPQVRIAADAPAVAFRNGPRSPVRQRGQALIYLALSGGGGGGAFGAGVLNGWSESGKRPQFNVVSGVSTGALIAPFAFLGPAYDGLLKEVYTNGSAEKLLQSGPLGGFGGNGGGLRHIVDRYLDDDTIAKIGQEDRKGRRLIVVTTDLDRQRAILWDMGAIAAAGTPAAYNLFREVLTASASIPIVFPPVLIDAEADGHRFQEMHVDGSVTTPVYTLPQAFLFGGAKAAPGGPPPIMYILINSYVEPVFELVPDSTPAIAARTFAAATRVNTAAILGETYRFAHNVGASFNLTYIDKSIPETTGIGFETAYMRQLYDYGYDKARAGAFWEAKPPTVEPVRAVQR
jgi:hypothetical protein